LFFCCYSSAQDGVEETPPPSSASPDSPGGSKVAAAASLPVQRDEGEEEQLVELEEQPEEGKEDDSDAKPAAEPPAVSSVPASMEEHKAEEQMEEVQEEVQPVAAITRGRAPALADSPAEATRSRSKEKERQSPADRTRSKDKSKRKESTSSSAGAAAAPAPPAAKRRKKSTSSTSGAKKGGVSSSKGLTARDAGKVYKRKVIQPARGSLEKQMEEAKRRRTLQKLADKKKKQSSQAQESASEYSSSGEESDDVEVLLETSSSKKQSQQQQQKKKATSVTKKPDASSTAKPTGTSKKKKKGKLKDPPPPPVAASQASSSTHRPSSLATEKKQEMASKMEPLFVVVDGVKIDITEAHPTIEDQQPCRPPRATSKYWKAFHCLPNDTSIAYCNLCGKDIPVGNAGTTGMKQHLNHQHPHVLNLVAPTEKPPAPFKQPKEGVAKGKEKKKISTNLYQHGLSSRSVTKADKELATEKALTAATMYLVMKDRPYSDIADPRFRGMIEAAVDAAKIGAQYVGFSVQAAKEKCQLLASWTRSRLIEGMQGKKITATFDHWISRATLNYSSLTLHWIQDFELHHSVMSVYVYSGPSNAEAINADFTRKLEEFGVRPFVKHVVTDTAANMNKAGILLEKDGVDHVYCTDHTLQLVAKKAYTARILGEGALREARERARAKKLQAEKEFQEAEEALKRSMKPAAEPPQPPPPRIGAARGSQTSTEAGEGGEEDQGSSAKPAASASDTITEEERKVLEAALKMEDNSPDALQEEKEAMAVDTEEKNVSGVLRKVRMIVAYFRRSTQAMGELRNLYHFQFLGEGGADKPDAPAPGKKGRLSRDFGMVQDVITRWWSTYSMLERFLFLKKDIKEYSHRNRGFRKTKSTNKIEDLLPDEWEALEDLQSLLKPFMVVMEVLQGNHFVTSSIVPAIISHIQSNLENAASPGGKLNQSVKDCAREMLARFKAQYGDFKRDAFNEEVVRGDFNRQVGIHRSLFVACALDPRFKDLRAVPENQREAVWSYVLELIVDRECERKMEANRQREEQRLKEQQEKEGKSGTSAATAVAIGSPVNKGEGEVSGEQKESSPDSPVSPSRDLFASLPPANPEPPMSPDEVDDMRHSVKSAMKLQLRDYRRQEGLNVCTDKIKVVDPLGWWKIHHEDFKNVWLLAEEFLAIPATSADSERAFSNSNNVLTLNRTRLASKLVDDAVHLKQNQEVIDSILEGIYGPFEKFQYANR